MRCNALFRKSSGCIRCSRMAQACSRSLGPNLETPLEHAHPHTHPNRFCVRTYPGCRSFDFYRLSFSLSEGWPGQKGYSFYVVVLVAVFPCTKENMPLLCQLDEPKNIQEALWRMNDELARPLWSSGRAVVFERFLTAWLLHGYSESYQLSNRSMR